MYSFIAWNFNFLFSLLACHHVFFLFFAAHSDSISLFPDPHPHPPEMCKENEGGRGGGCVLAPAVLSVDFLGALLRGALTED